MSRVIKWGALNPIPFYDEKYGMELMMKVDGECEYVCEQEDKFTEEQLKSLDNRMKLMLINNCAKSIGAMEAGSIQDVVRRLMEDDVKERFFKDAESQGCKILSIQMIPILEEESKKKMQEVVFKKYEEALKAQGMDVDALKASMEKNTNNSGEPLKQAEEKPKQLTAEELAALPTASGPLDSVKEKIGKIFGIFSK